MDDEKNGGYTCTAKGRGLLSTPPHGIFAPSPIIRKKYLADGGRDIDVWPKKMGKGRRGTKETR